MINNYCNKALTGEQSKNKTSKTLVESIRNDVRNITKKLKILEDEYLKDKDLKENGGCTAGTSPTRSDGA